MEHVPSYRERLRTEGLALAACGALGSAVLLAAVPDSRENPASTIGQLAVVALLLAALGPRSVRRSAALSVPAAELDEPLTGDATPLWTLPLICAALAALFAPAGLDASLRITGGCLLVGLAQAVLLERTAAAEERRLGTRLVRAPGSSLVRGTRLARV